MEEVACKEVREYKEEGCSSKKVVASKKAVVRRVLVVLMVIEGMEEGGFYG